MDKDDLLAKRSEILPAQDRRKTAFFRIWCLAEIGYAKETALTQPLSIIIRCGSQDRSKVHSHPQEAFVPDPKTLAKMAALIDVSKAEASVQSDRQRIFAEIEQSPGGCDHINKLVRATCKTTLAAESYTQVFGELGVKLSAAACGDHAYNITEQGFRAAASFGYTGLVAKVLDLHAFMVFSEDHLDGSSALSVAAAEGQVIDCVVIRCFFVSF